MSLKHFHNFFKAVTTKGKELVDLIISSIHYDSFIMTVDSPIKNLKKYYQSLGFIYQKNLYDWSGTIYKVVQK